MYYWGRMCRILVKVAVEDEKESLLGFLSICLMMRLLFELLGRLKIVCSGSF